MGVKEKPSEHIVEMKAFQILCLTLTSCSAAPQLLTTAADATAADDFFAPPVYAYNYGVNDDETGTQFSQNEQRDGAVTTGSYTVALPDGRIKTVKYTDNGDGVTYDVSYDGVAVAATPAAPEAVAATPIISHPTIVSHSPVISHTTPVISHPTPVISHATPLVSHASPVISHSVSHPVISHSSPVISHSTPIISHATPVVSHAGHVVSHASPIVSHTAPILSHA